MKTQESPSISANVWQKKR